MIYIYFFIIILFQSCSVIIPLKDLPTPNGNYIIGTDIMILEDQNRLETFTKTIDDNRKIVVQVWYPATSKSDSLYPYLDYKDIKVPYIAKRLEISEKIVNHVNKIKANSYYQATPSTDEFPLIIFSHGLGGNRMQNTINIESLVSNGYIVFSIEHTYDANITVFNDSTFAEFDSYLPDDVSVEEFYNVRIPQIKVRANDVSFLIDKIETLKSQNHYLGRMSNMNSIGVFGHSFGGGTAALSSALDNRIKACITLDGWFEPIPPNILNKGINIPFLFIGQPQEEWITAPYNNQQLTTFHDNNTNDSFIIEIKNTKHMDYSDISYITIWSRFLGLSGKDGRNINLDLNTTIVNFFNYYFKKQEVDWLLDIRNNYDIINRSKRKI
tara:strand:+ start:5237 stop:6385 length:1149 start_codon:yes stop_codon:yes gene_type:complete